jgi:hypothetical protein
MNILKIFQKKWPIYFAISDIINALTESLHVVPKLQNTLNAMSHFKDRRNSGLLKNTGYQLLQISEMLTVNLPLTGALNTVG